MNNPLVSVVVPVYNVASYLEQCLDSVVNQTYKNLEIILVDDGSTDDSGAICDRYVEKDSRIQVIHKENGGLSSARNVGLERITGEWALFIDSDDWIELNTLELLFEQKDERSEIVEFGLNVVYSNNVECYINIPSLMSGRDALTMLVTKSLYMGTMCNKMFKVDAIRGLSFMEGRCHEDTPFIMELLYSMKGYYQYVAIPLYNYRRRDGQITSGFTAKRLDLYHNFEDLMIKYEGTELVKYIQTCYLYWAKSYFFEIFIQPFEFRKKNEALTLPYLKKARRMSFISFDKNQRFQWRLFQLMPRFYAYLVVYVQPVVKKLIGR